jgi:hypothetical protein
VLEQLFKIGGERLRVITNDPILREGFCRWFAPLAAARTNRDRKYYVFSVENNAFPVRIPSDARPFHSGAHSGHFIFKNLWIIDFQGNGQLVVDLAGGTILGFFRTGYPAVEPWFTILMVHPLIELLRRQGLFQVHAGGVSFAGQGVLLAGESQSGKTTLGLHLVSQGFRFLADDRGFLVKRGDTFEVRASTESVNVYPPNVADLPEFHFLQDSETAPDGKVTISIEEVYSGSQVDCAVLQVIIFPCWLAEEETRLEALSNGEALRLLLPLTLEPFFPEPVFPETARGYFQFNSDLVAKTPCFRMYLGHDKETWAILVRNLIS